MNSAIGTTKFQETRFIPSEDIAFFVEHYWHVRWDLTDCDPYISETLPHPCVHIVFEPDSSSVIGVVQGKFTRRLSGRGEVFGIKFRPGGFYPFVKTSISSFTGKVLPLADVFGDHSRGLNTEVLSLGDPIRMAERAEQFLHHYVPPRDNTVAVIHSIVDRIITDKGITKVDDIVRTGDISKRTLQRNFNRYVGINPKWMIKRYRLHEAVALMDTSDGIDLTRLAVQLGYFDQAHFIKDFKRVVGATPSKYINSLRII